MKGRAAWIGTVLAITLALLGWFLGRHRTAPTQEAARPASVATLPPGVVEVSLERQRKMELQVLPAATASVRSSLRLTGEIRSVPGAQVIVTAPVPGRVMTEPRLGRITVGSRVEKGQPLTVLESFSTGLTGLSAEAQLKQEEANFTRAQADWERAQRLYAAGLISLKDSQQAETDYLATKGRLEALQRQVQLYRELQLSRGEEAEPGRFWVRAPISGIVNEWKTTPGQTVAADEALATITNISKVIAEANLFIDDLSRVRLGQAAVCTTDAYPHESFRGELSYIGPQTESGTRVVPVHVLLANSNGKLRIGMPVEVAIEIGPERQAILVPREAVIFEEGIQVVYVQTAHDLFERRVVRLGETTPTSFEIREGLRPGETVVVRGAFLIKAEALKGGLPPAAEAGEQEEKRER